MIVYAEKQKLSTDNLFNTNLGKLLNAKSMHKNYFYFYRPATNSLKIKI